MANARSIIATCLVAAALGLGCRGDAMSSGEASGPAVAGEADLPAGWSRVIVELQLGAPAAGPSPAASAAPADDPVRRAAIREARERLLAALPPGEYRLTRAFDAIPFVALQVSPAGLRALRESPWSGGVEPDRTATTQGAAGGGGDEPTGPGAIGSPADEKRPAATPRDPAAR